MLLGLGLGRTLELSCSFKDAGVQLKQSWCAFCVKIVSVGLEKSWGGGCLFVLFFQFFQNFQKASCFSFLHWELDLKTFCSPAATPFLSKEGNSDGIAFSYNYSTLYLVAFSFDQLTGQYFPCQVESFPDCLSISKIKTGRKKTLVLMRLWKSYLCILDRDFVQQLSS